SASFGWKPTTLSTTSPFFITSKVGMLITPNFAAVSWLSSTSSFTIFTLSPTSESNSSNTGAIILQGPHHGAQKSANTNPSFVSASKFWSVTFVIAIITPPIINNFEILQRVYHLTFHFTSDLLHK